MSHDHAPLPLPHPSSRAGDNSQCEPVSSPAKSVGDGEEAAEAGLKISKWKIKSFNFAAG